MKGIIGTPMVIEFKKKSRTDINDCEIYEEQVFIYHVIKEGKEIGRTVSKTPARAIRNVAHRIHKKNPNKSYSEIKNGCYAVIYDKDIKEIRKVGNKVKIIWDWSNA